MMAMICFQLVSVQACNSKSQRTTTPALTGIQQQNVRVGTIVILGDLRMGFEILFENGCRLSPAQQACFLVL